MPTSARRRSKPIVEIRGTVSLRVKTKQLHVELRRELGLEGQQLELAIAPASTSIGSAPRVPTTSTLVLRPKPTCSECGRRGYHLKRCSKRSRARGGSR